MGLMGPMGRMGLGEDCCAIGCNCGPQDFGMTDRLDVSFANVIYSPSIHLLVFVPLVDEIIKGDLYAQEKQTTGE